MAGKFSINIITFIGILLFLIIVSGLFIRKLPQLTAPFHYMLPNGFTQISHAATTTSACSVDYCLDIITPEDDTDLRRTISNIENELVDSQTYPTDSMKYIHNGYTVYTDNRMSAEGYFTKYYYLLLPSGQIIEISLSSKDALSSNSDESQVYEEMDQIGNEFLASFTLKD